MPAEKHFDLVTLGEILIDFTPDGLPRTVFRAASAILAALFSMRR